MPPTAAWRFTPRFAARPTSWRSSWSAEGGLSDAHLARWKQIVGHDDGFDAFAPVLREFAVPKPIPVPTTSPAAAVSQPAAGGPRPAASGPLRPIPLDSAASGGETILGVSTGATAVQSAPGRLAAKPLPLPAKRPTLLDDAPIELDEPAPTIAAAPVGMTMPDVPFNRPSPEALAKKHRRARRMAVINLCGHVMAAGLGLMIGYYILCIISPESNVLHLNLPGVPAAAQPAAGQPGGTPGSPAGSTPATPPVGPKR